MDVDVLTSMTVSAIKGKGFRGKYDTGKDKGKFGKANETNNGKGRYNDGGSSTGGSTVGGKNTGRFLCSGDHWARDCPRGKGGRGKFGNGKDKQGKGKGGKVREMTSDYDEWTTTDASTIGPSASACVRGLESAHLDSDSWRMHVSCNFP